MPALDFLKDRTDSRVQTALTRKCGICKVKPGADCHYPWETTDRMDRIVHQERAEQHLDKRRAS